MRRRVLRHLVVLGGLLAVYYAVPIGRRPSGVEAALGVIGVVVGGGVLAVLIARQVRRQLQSPPDDDAVRLESLLVLIYVTVVVFSLGYLLLADATDDQFVGLETKTDALYFTITTLATVGFGDVVPTGQVARALVTAQIVFNLVFVGALVTMVTGHVRRRATGPRTGRPPPGSP